MSIELTVITATHCADWNRGVYYDLKFPIFELANAIGIFGWGITTEMPKDGPIGDKLQELRERNVWIPRDAETWIATYATKRQEKPFGGIFEELGAIVIC